MFWQKNKGDRSILPDETILQEGGRLSKKLLDQHVEFISQQFGKGIALTPKYTVEVIKP